MTARATVYDVARVAGVSIKTVSRVVNGSHQVTVATRERVQSAMTALSYVRNPVAYSLATGSSDSIGVVIDSIADRFFSQLVSAVEERALAHGVGVLIASTGRSADRERHQVARLLAQNVGAIMLAPTAGDHRPITEAAGNIPIVLIDRRWELPGFDSIRVQDHRGGALATAHLLDHGHRRIALLGEAVELETVTARRDGYLQTLRARGVECIPELVRPDCSSAEDAVRATRELLALPDPPTAIFASNPRAGMGTVSALHTARRTDVAVVSFGDFDLADSVLPAVTVISQDPRRIAEAATDRVLARMAGQPLPPADLILDVELIIRGSGELRP